MRTLLASLLLCLLSSCYSGGEVIGPPLDHDLHVRLVVWTEVAGEVTDRAEADAVLAKGTPLTDRIELEAEDVTLHVLGLTVEGDELYFRGWGYRGQLGSQGLARKSYATETTGSDSERTYSATLDGDPATGVLARIDPDEGPSTVERFELSFERR